MVSMVNLTRLTTLLLAFNEFTGIIKFDMFTKLESLEFLWLSEDLNLAYESLNYTFPSLETLWLNACNLTRIPYFLISLKGLLELDLSSNRIGGEIPTWFQDIGKDTMEGLYLSDNNFNGEIPFLICSLSSLQYLYFEYNNLS